MEGQHPFNQQSSLTLIAADPVTQPEVRASGYAVEISHYRTSQFYVRFAAISPTKAAVEVFGFFAQWTKSICSLSPWCRLLRLHKKYSGV